MSCVVGIIENKTIYMGSDGVATTEDGEKRPIKATKIFRNGNYLLGFTGSVRAGQVIFPEYFDPPTNVYELPDAIREHMSHKGTLMIGENQVQMHNTNFLVGYQGKLYEILIDFQMNEIKGGFTAIGSGSTFALGSLYTSKQFSLHPEERIEIALEAACEYDMACGRPFHIERHDGT